MDSGASSLFAQVGKLYMVYMIYQLLHSDLLGVPNA